MPAAFTHANGSVTFTRNPARPARSDSRLQPLAETAAGLTMARSSYASERTMELEWPAMTLTNLNSLTIFLQSTVKGTANSFTYTDPAGASYTVRFLSPEISSSEVAKDLHRVHVVLKVLS